MEFYFFLGGGAGCLVVFWGVKSLVERWRGWVSTSVDLCCLGGGLFGCLFFGVVWCCFLLLVCLVIFFCGFILSTLFWHGFVVFFLVSLLDLLGGCLVA